MAVTEVKLLSTGASGGVEGTDADNLRVSYSSTYQAKCDSQTDSPTTVLHYFRTHSNLPWPGRTYKFGTGFDTNAICFRVNPSLIENSGGIYTVACEFKDRDSEDSSPANIEPPDAPERWNPEIEITSGTISMPVEFATFLGNNGNKSPFMKEGKWLPVTNSALKPFNPTFEEEFSYKIIRFTTNLREYDDAFYNRYQDAINKSEVEINIPRLKFRTYVAKHYGKLNIGASLNFTSSGVMYWRRTIELLIRGWDRAVLDRATCELYVAGDRRPDGTIVSDSDFARGRISLEIPVKDDDDLTSEGLCNLDGAGKRLKEGQPPVVLGWQAFQEQDFSQIKWV